MKRCGLHTRVSTQIQAETKEGSLKIQRQRLEADVKSKNGGHILGYDLDSRNKGYLKINQKRYTAKSYLLLFLLLLYMS